MDDPLQDLENELKALRPRRPSVLLRARVERELEAAGAAAGATEKFEPRAERAALSGRRYTTASTFRSWKWLGWQAGAAAVVMLGLTVGVWRWQAREAARPVEELAAGKNATTTHSESVSEPMLPPATQLAAAPTRDVYRPVKAANVLYDLRDEGVVLLDDNTTARRVRARYLDTYTWKNPATNASMRWSVPRDEVRVMPASFH